MASPPGDFLHGYLPYLLRQADQTLSAPLYAVLQDEGVARSDWRVLAVLRETGPLTVAHLAEAALSPQPTVTHALRRMESKGLVQRTDNEQDRRHTVVSMTAKGHVLTDRLVAAADELAANMLSACTDVDDLKSRLIALTQELQARLELVEAPAAITAVLNRGSDDDEL